MLYLNGISNHNVAVSYSFFSDIHRGIDSYLKVIDKFYIFYFKTVLPGAELIKQKWIYVMLKKEAEDTKYLFNNKYRLVFSIIIPTPPQNVSFLPVAEFSSCIIFLLLRLIFKGGCLCVPDLNHWWIFVQKAIIPHLLFLILCIPKGLAFPVNFFFIC